jgi:hypothetical protein
MSPEFTEEELETIRKAREELARLPPVPGRLLRVEMMLEELAAKGHLTPEQHAESKAALHKAIEKRTRAAIQETMTQKPAPPLAKAIMEEKAPPPPATPPPATPPPATPPPARPPLARPPIPTRALVIGGAAATTVALIALAVWAMRR